MLATGQFRNGRTLVQAWNGTWLLSKAVSGAMRRRLALQHDAARNLRKGAVSPKHNDYKEMANCQRSRNKKIEHKITFKSL